MRTKIFSAILIVAIIIVASLAGCNLNKESDVTTITYWATASPVAEQLTEIINRYNNTEGKEQGIYVDYKIVYKTEKELESVFLSKKEPDVISFPKTFGISTLVEKRWVRSLNAIDGGLLFASECSPESLVKYSEKVYAKSVTYETYRIVYNSDVLGKYCPLDENGKIVFPKTWSDLAGVIETVTKESGCYGIAFPMKDDDAFWKTNLIYAFDGAESSGKQLHNLYSYNRAFDDFIFPVMRSKSNFPDSQWIDNEDANLLFANEKIAMKIASYEDVYNISKNYNTDFGWDIAPLPVYDENDESLRIGYKDEGFAYITNKVLYKQDPAPILSFYKWLTGEKVQNELLSKNACLILGKNNYKEEVFRNDIISEMCKIDLVKTTDEVHLDEIKKKFSNMYE